LTLTFGFIIIIMIPFLFKKNINCLPKADLAPMQF